MSSQGSGKGRSTGKRRDLGRSETGEHAASASLVHRGASRALDILEFLVESPEAFTLSELSRRLNVPKSSLLALLRTFTERGYLEHQTTGLYHLGPRAMQIGLRSPFRRELPALAGPILVTLAERSGESVFLGVVADTPPEVVYVDKVESRNRIRYTADLGERRPLYCTAPGLAIFAFLPEGERDRLLETLDLKPYTDRTLTDRHTLRARLDEVRRVGVAVAMDEFLAGAGSVAAPIFDREGAPVATCSVIGPSPRIIARREELSYAVKAAADAISRRLGFHPSRND